MHHVEPAASDRLPPKTIVPEMSGRSIQEPTYRKPAGEYTRWWRLLCSPSNSSGHARPARCADRKQSVVRTAPRWAGDLTHRVGMHR